MPDTRDRPCGVFLFSLVLENFPRALATTLSSAATLRQKPDKIKR
jgi:hypothetical protein